MIDIRWHTSHYSLKPLVTVFKPLKAYYQTRLGYQTYLLSVRYQNFDDDVISQNLKMMLGIKVQLKFQVFHGYDLVSILGFFSGLQMACDTSRIYAGAAMCLLYFIMKKILPKPPSERLPIFSAVAHLKRGS